jgi:hypothetical protein
MSKLLVIGRLACRDLRLRRAEATLMLIVVTAATVQPRRPVGFPSAWGLVAVVLLALTGLIVISAGPARAAARLPVAEILQAEA